MKSGLFSLCPVITQFCNSLTVRFLRKSLIKSPIYFYSLLQYFVVLFIVTRQNLTDQHLQCSRILLAIIIYSFIFIKVNSETSYGDFRLRRLRYDNC